MGECSFTVWVVAHSRWERTCPCTDKASKVHHSLNIHPKRTIARSLNPKIKIPKEEDHFILQIHVALFFLI